MTTTLFNMNLTDFIGNISTLCTMGLFLTGTQICHGIYKKGIVGDVASLPFITMIAK
jgi:hypothetical protein